MRVYKQGFLFPETENLISDEVSGFEVKYYSKLTVTQESDNGQHRCSRFGKIEADKKAEKL